MTIAQQLAIKGKAEGEAKGIWIGRLQLLEELMGLAVSDPKSFAGLDAAQLQARYETLHSAYQLRLKQL